MRDVTVARLMTFVDIDGESHVSARHEAVLADGRHVVLLDDRGWTGPDHTVQETQRTARMVVGPDEPFEDRTWSEMEADHWEALARVLAREGITTDATTLRALPHDVELSDRVRERIAGR